MKVLELFAGSCTFSRTAKEHGHETYTIDIVDNKGINMVEDLLYVTPQKIPFKPDVVWASPPCTTFSVASIGYHWQGGHRAYIPKTSKAYIGLALVKKTLEIMEYFQPDFWYLENPRGLLRKLPVVKDLPIRNTISFCKYGDIRMKPTDIWTNDESWIPREMCKNGNPDCHHERAPRGSRTGTQGLKGSYERGILPVELCQEVVKNFSGIKC
jgi:hypothetical protein|tara:strand:- start:491 stop:1126 length:636 start_codon:yes stop_codon:yes gene_type:complete